MLKEKRNGQGFTLIELLVVVLIVGILASIALPQYQMAVIKSRYATMKNIVHALASAEEIHYLANGVYTEDLEALSIEGAGCSLSDDTPRQCFYSWGRCQVMARESSSEFCASCNNTDIGMQYRVYFDHSIAAPGGRICIAYNRDLNSIQNKLCRAETGATTPGTGTTNAYTWRY